MKNVISMLSIIVTSAAVKSEIEPNKVSISGHFLGVGNHIDQENEDRVNNERTQYDCAVNLDFNWEISERVKGIAQLQSSPGRGSFGFPGPNIVVTDLNLEISFPKLRSTLIAGSYDAPFGITTDYLTNNADATRNAFFLNSLLYSMLGGETGTLNAVGIMGLFESNHFEFAAAEFNNLDENSHNLDGYMTYVGRGTIKFNNDVTSAASFIYARENGTHGIYGWLVESLVPLNFGLTVNGYWGDLTFDDDNSTTKDDVRSWSGEIQFALEKVKGAVRISGWQPDDNNGNDTGFSTLIPAVGFALPYAASQRITRDQDVYRSQLALTYTIMERLELKGELFRDDYKRVYLSESADVHGGILILQGSF